MESEEPVLFDVSRWAWGSTLMDLEGEAVKRLDISNGSKKAAAVATAAEQTGLGSDGYDKMTATAAAQGCLSL